MTPLGVAAAATARGGCRWLRPTGCCTSGPGAATIWPSSIRGAGGNRSWVRDTTGSAQAVTVMGEQLVVGGHFWEVADHLNDDCGHRLGGQRPQRRVPDQKGHSRLLVRGRLDPDWDPSYAGKYSLVWALHVEGARLHTGGEFLTVNGVTQNYYARFSPDSIKGNNKPNTLVGTLNDDSIYGYGGADRIHARGGDDTLGPGDGSDKVQGGRGDDRIRAVDGSKDDVSCGPGADRVKANPEDNIAEGCEKVERAGKRIG